MMWPIELLAFAGLLACIVRVALIVWPPPGAKLPHPSKVAGMPMAGPASQASAHAALSRQRSASRPKFRT
jgi:hypothetical protein